ncbi:RNA-directed DNA polymerase, eukaryota, reverse transcriptase zinc-binding domain protein [Tanacetum coccineum]
MVEVRTLQLEVSRQDTIWNKLVTKKVNIFVWRALKKRLPVREELDKRGIDLDTVLCPCCDSGMESCEHSLALCDMAMDVWEKIHSWWKLGGVSAFSIMDFFYLNGNVNLSNNLRLLWQAVLWTSGCEILGNAALSPEFAFVLFGFRESAGVLCAECLNRNINTINALRVPSLQTHIKDMSHSAIVHRSSSSAPTFEEETNE